MKQKPKIFLTLSILLVPREMRVERSGGCQSDEQLEQGVEAVKAMLAAREGRGERQGYRRRGAADNSPVTRKQAQGLLATK